MELTFILSRPTGILHFLRTFMMKQAFLVSLLFLGQFSFGQSKSLVAVPGTKCSLAPPDGFVKSTTFSGFQHNETGASIMINELPAPYRSVVDGFTAENLKSRGMTLVSKELIDFNNSTAALIKVTQSANGVPYIKQILIFGDSDHAVLVNGIFPEASKSIEPKIKEALLSAVYNASQNENPLDAVAFAIDISGTEFKLVRYFSGSLLYSTDGKIPTEKPTLIVGSAIAGIPVQNQKKYAEERLRKLPGGDHSEIKEIKEVTINDLKGYEIVADGKTKDNNPQLVYQVMLFTETGDYYLIVGHARSDSQDHLEIFRRVSKTFKRK